MKNSGPQRISLAIFFLLSLVIIFNRLLLPRFNTHDIFAIISWDVFGYYLYLPANFIHHDLGIRNFEWVHQVLETYHPTFVFYQAAPGPEADLVMKYTMGMAIMYSPFFFLGHVIAHLTGFSPDGFTFPYQLSIAIGGLVYTVTGLWFLRKILLRFFDDRAVACSMLLIVAGTNYFQLTAFDGAMPHNYLFTVFALIVWLTIRWHEDPRWKYALAIGLLCGLALLIRPTAIIICLVPVLWGLSGIRSLREKISLVAGNAGQVLVMIAAMSCMIGIQMLYWKLHSGSWLYYSYEKGEKLEWIARYLLKVLFSYKKGWLVYAPVMVFALAGFVPLARRYRSLFATVFIFFAVHLLIVASWNAWWYAGCFGQRAMMESYLLLAFPAAALMQWLFRQRKILRLPVFTVMALFILLNLFQTWQYMHLIIDPMQMTKEYYWAVFGKTKLGESDKYYLEPTTQNEERDFLIDTTKYSSKTIAAYDFETPGQANPANLCRDTARSGSYSLRMNQGLQFSPGINIPYKDLAGKNFAWLRLSAWVWFSCKPEEAACGLVVTGYRNGAVYKYRQLELEKENLKPGVWNKVEMDYVTPFFKDKNNPVQTYFWYRGEIGRAHV